MLQAGEKIYYYKIELDFAKDNSNQKVEELEVIGANEEYFVLNDYFFTKLYQKSGKYNTSYCVFNKPSVSHFKMFSYDEVKGYFYTKESNEKKALKKLKAEIEKFLYEKFGKYCKGVDLLNAINVDEVKQ